MYGLSTPPGGAGSAATLSPPEGVPTSTLPQDLYGQLLTEGAGGRQQGLGLAERTVAAVTNQNLNSLRELLGYNGVLGLPGLNPLWGFPGLNPLLRLPDTTLVPPTGSAAYETLAAIVREQEEQIGTLLEQVTAPQNPVNRSAPCPPRPSNKGQSLGNGMDPLRSGGLTLHSYYVEGCSRKSHTQNGHKCPFCKKAPYKHKDGLNKHLMHKHSNMITLLTPAEYEMNVSEKGVLPPPVAPNIDDRSPLINKKTMRCKADEIPATIRSDDEDSVSSEAESTIKATPKSYGKCTECRYTSHSVYDLYQHKFEQHGKPLPNSIKPRRKNSGQYTRPPASGRRVLYRPPPSMVLRPCTKRTADTTQNASTGYNGSAYTDPAAESTSSNRKRSRKQEKPTHIPTTGGHKGPYMLRSCSISGRDRKETSQLTENPVPPKHLRRASVI